MSADNYYTIKQDDNGKYVPCMGFMSSLEYGFGVEIRPQDPRFDTWEAAAKSTIDDTLLKPLRDEYIAKWGDPFEDQE